MSDRISRAWTQWGLGLLMIGSMGLLLPFQVGFVDIGIYQFFGFLWGEDSEKEPTQEQLQIREIFEELRTEILDKGNDQIRHSEAELESYDIIWNKYHLNLPLQKINET